MSNFITYGRFGAHLCLVTPRRWLDQCNPGLSNLIQEALGIPKAEFLKDLYKLEGLLKYVDNTSFQKKWAAVKQSNKERLAHYVETTLGYKVNTQAMFDVQIKVCSLLRFGSAMILMLGW